MAAHDRTLVRRPGWVRAVGGACRVLERARLLDVELHEEGMLEAARRRTGLSDFGDPSFAAALGTLLRSLREEADLDLIGRFAIRNWCVDLLSNRLAIQRQLTRHPEILDVPIRRPLFVIGWPRTGTTLLQKLLAAQSGARPLLFWEQFAPAPPADLAPGARDPRPRAARAFIRNLRAISPTIDVTHPIAATEPEECNGLFQNSFVTPLFTFLAEMPTYRAFIREQDMTAPYRYYRQQLQLLSWKTTFDHWVLKGPAHGYALDALLAVFPDANIVFTHRAPREVIPSLCSLTVAYRRVFTARLDPRTVGAYWMEELAHISRLIATARSAADPRRFLDVDYADLLGDPLGTVVKVHEHFGYDVDPSVASTVRGWLAENPQHKNGVHRYDAATFGLAADEIDRRFAEFPSSALTARTAWAR